ncbi:MAG: EF-P lysine aminoacylase EpmA [Pseudomonadota bacterium]
MNTAWRPGHTLEVARLRARMLARARQWFADRDILEVTTPALDAAAVSDVNIESIAATIDALDGPRYLHTSPEYAMKRLLAAGFPDIYQICTVFRDGEVGRRHQPEFTMLEWYRHDMDLDAIVRDAVGLIRLLLGDGATQLTHDTHHLRYDDALRTACGVGSDSAIDALRAAAGDALTPGIEHDRDALLDYLFACEVAPGFADETLTVITHYPAAQAALARIDAASGRALRFEVFHGALELANGFVELTDAVTQRQRFDNDQSKRRALGRALRPLDERFLAALSHGLPDCAGVALGFDRLVMRAAGCDTIGAVTSFPHGKASSS